MITVITVFALCLFCQVKGDVPDDLVHNTQNCRDNSTTGSGDLNEISHNGLPCGVSGNLTFYSIDDALNNISSNDVIYIISDTVLSTNFTLEGLENITIIGQRNPVVFCNNTGAIKFISCKAVIIEGVRWEHCGSIPYPAIEFYNSSTLSFERCAFYNSIGQSILFLEVSGNVSISKCDFMHGNQEGFGGHGTAIYYLPNTTSHSENKLLIQNSNFTFIRATKSVVYINGSGSSIPVHVYLQAGVFVNNTAVPIVISWGILHIRSSVLFQDNNAISGGGIRSTTSIIVFHDKSKVKFINNSAKYSGGAIVLFNSTITFETRTIVTLSGNNAQEGSGGAVYSKNSSITFDFNSSVTFSGNKARHLGGAVYCLSSSNITINGNSSVKFDNNKANNGGAVCCLDSSCIKFYDNSNVKFISNNASYVGGAVCCRSSSHLTFDDNSSVTFTNNEAGYGGAVHFEYSSNITLEGYSNVTFTNNKASIDGGAVYSYYSSHIIFNGNTSVTFNNNIAGDDGGAMNCHRSSHITFDGNTRVTFKNNIAANKGGALHCHTLSNIAFDGYSSVIFNVNKAHFAGGAVSFNSSSHLKFNGHSVTIFNGNKALYGGGVSCLYLSHLIFDDNSSVKFTSNNASNVGGAVYCSFSSHLTFDDKSSVTFINNEADYGGAVHFAIFSNITLEGYSNVTFTNNKASIDGGAVHSWYFSHIIFNGNTSVTFNSNIASDDGGAMHCHISSHIIFDGSTSVTFKNNIARDNGGAVHCQTSSHITFDGYSSVTFNANKARFAGGAVSFNSSSHLKFNGHSVTIFNGNKALYGGGVLCSYLSHITFDGNCRVMFDSNTAGQSGGALFIADNSTATITGHSKIIYSSNKGYEYGGAIYCSDNSNVTLNENVEVKFVNNTSEYGGAISIILQSAMTFNGNISVNFTGNKAENGGAISAANALVTFADKSRTRFFKNSATGSGGAIHLSNRFTINHNSQVMFYQNTANRYGGAIYCDLTKSSESKIILNKTKFHKNTDVVQSDVYMDIPISCDKTCLNNSIIISKEYGHFEGNITTSPRELKLNGSTVECISNSNNTICEIYLTRNIMLGQKILTQTCVLDFYKQFAGPTQFVVSSEEQNHQINGPNNVLISCGLFEGLSVKGKEVVKPINYSINITSFKGSISDIQKLSIKLIAELSPCHHGFHYDNATKKCVCYSDSDIVSCSGSTSAIKRGYWYGKVDGKATVAVCPSKYCNFSCCETANGYVELSPIRDNQCNLQRYGTACGSCKRDYTLSFDSVKCVSIYECAAGQTALVMTLSILFWVIIIVIVFFVTYYHIGIGYLYAITYYYSMVDILLGEHLYISEGLFTFVGIMTSIAKITPQFLGQLCLVPNMSGIDQELIHYMHPLAVAIIIIIICQSARISYKFSSFVSRGIIHVICFLLLLSYTSVATTSLLLLRSLTFDNVDQVYTHLSPDIEYFHGRHLPYAIIAILCTIVIVIGLPLLLLLEPLLNHKVSFNRIKPLLDQFQGCYEDKYRSFAAYYMVCRLVIILIIIGNPSNSDTTQYLLIISNSLLALIHVALRPYKSSILNVFDGFVLQLIIVVSMVPLIDSYDHDLLLAFMLILVILPLILFLIMEFYLYKKTIKKITAHCFPREPDTATNEVPMSEIIENSVIDDSRRVNATICDM